MALLVNQILLMYGKKHFCNTLNANTCDSDLKNKIMAKFENIHITLMT